MKIVLDTNVLLVSISSRSKYRPILDAFLDEKFELVVTTEILLEYEEIISKHMGKKSAEIILQLIENAPNVQWVTNYFKWELISADADDNKFTDCAVSCGARYLVSNDKHFNTLKKILFPKIELLKANEFMEIIGGK